MTPDEWEDFSNDNMIAAEKQRQNSVALRSLMDGVLQSVANDMKRQTEMVDDAMTRRIHETRDAKCKLEEHLSKVRRFALNIFIDIQTSKTLTQMDINKMMRMEFIQWRVNTYSQKAKIAENK